jgi:ATP-binding cassette subfamily F protein uup
MDRLVDHLFVFQGDGDIRDFPGNYSQYRMALKDDEKLTDIGTQMMEKKEDKPPVPAPELKNTGKKKLSYKEQREFDSLEQEMEKLNTEKAGITERLNSGTLPFGELQKLSLRIAELAGILDEKELRWLALSDS